MEREAGEGCLYIEPRFETVIFCLGFDASQREENEFFEVFYVECYYLFASAIMCNKKTMLVVGMVKKVVSIHAKQRNNKNKNKNNGYVLQSSL